MDTVFELIDGTDDIGRKSLGLFSSVENIILKVKEADAENKALSSDDYQSEPIEELWVVERTINHLDTPGPAILKITREDAMIEGQFTWQSSFEKIK